MKESIKKRIEAVRRGEVPEGYVSENHQLRPVHWRYEKIGKYLVPHDEFSNNTEAYPLATSSRQGLMLQSEYYSDQRYEETSGGFHVVPEGYVTYRHMSDDDIFRFNVNRMGTPVLVSPEYPVFTTAAGLDQNLLMAYLNNMKEFTAYCSAQKKGSTRTRMYFSRLGEFAMPIPPVFEQQKIAEILATCDRVIELKQQLLEEKRRQKRCFMQHFFQSDNWAKTTLSELADIDTGDADTQDRVIDGKYPFFVRSATIERIDTYSYDGEAILTPGDGKIGEIFHYFIGKFNYHQRVYKISNFHGCSGKYIYYYLQFFFKKRACLMTAKATVDSLRREMLTDMPIFLPSAAEQERIVCVLDSCEKEIELLQNALEYEKLKKKALMQLLLTGLVRVNA